MPGVPFATTMQILSIGVMDTDTPLRRRVSASRGTKETAPHALHAKRAPHLPCIRDHAPTAQLQTPSAASATLATTEMVSHALHARRAVQMQRKQGPVQQGLPQTCHSADATLATLEAAPRALRAGRRVGPTQRRQPHAQQDPPWM